MLEDIKINIFLKLGIMFYLLKYRRVELDV